VHQENAERTLAGLNDLYQRFLWDDADQQLASAEKLLGPEGDAGLRERLFQARENTAFVNQLDQIRLDASALVNDKWNPQAAVAKYRAAMEQHGFDFANGDAAELAAKLNASPVRPYLLAALDDWTMKERGAQRKALVAVAAAATGQRWRKELDAVLEDGDKLADLYDTIPEQQRTEPIMAEVGFHLDKLGKNGVRSLEAGVRQHPRDFWLHLDLGTLGGKKRAEARIGACRTALAIRPNTPSVLHNLGIALYDKKEYEAALEEFKEAIRLAPKFARAHHGLGSVLYAKKEYEAAIVEFKEAIRLDPQDSRPHHDLGAALADEKHYEAALVEFREAIRLNPEDAFPHNGLGSTLYGKKEYEAALVEYKEAIRLDPEFAIPHSGLAAVLYAKKEYEAALVEYKEAIRLDPEFAAPHGGLASVLWAKKEYDAALVEYKEAIRLDPQSAIAHYNLGSLLLAKKEYEAALVEFKEAIQLDPTYAGPHLGMGNVLRSKKEYKAAVVEYKEAIRLDPTSALPCVGLGNVLSDMQDYEAAIGAYNQAIRLAPQYSFPHHGLGNVLSAKKEYQAAIVEFKEAIRLDPKDARPHNDLGNTLFAKKDYEAAILEFKEVIRLGGNIALADANLGLVYRQMGRFPESVKALQDADQLMPNNAGISQELRKSQEYLSLDQRLPAILGGNDKPKTPLEAVQLASLASLECKKEYALAFRLFTEAFAADSELVETNRYKAACTAVQFAAGNDMRVRHLEPEEWYYLQERTHTWLMADLDALRKRAASANPADRQQAKATLAQWLEDSNLALIRDASLQSMPEPQRHAWESLWADIHKLLTDLDPPKKAVKRG